jgi:RNA methyltransferase, TrmH family
MISKAKIKYLKSLQVKKYRKEAQCFVVEGAKSVVELLKSDFEILLVLGTETFIGSNNRVLNRLNAEIISVTEADLLEAGTYQSNNAALAVAKMKTDRAPVLKPDEFALVLDDIRDPGNVGTIIRTADWYGITNIIASEETADFYNPKVISATMGSFCRVKVHYTSLAEYLSASATTIYGTFLDGADVHKLKFKTGGLVVIGNEANGISDEVAKYVNQKITIPRFGAAESLNAGIATAIILDNLIRSQK